MRDRNWLQVCDNVEIVVNAIIFHSLMGIEKRARIFNLGQFFDTLMQLVRAHLIFKEWEARFLLAADHLVLHVESQTVIAVCSDAARHRGLTRKASASRPKEVNILLEVVLSHKLRVNVLTNRRMLRGPRVIASAAAVAAAGVAAETI